jgi:hypothetical protein
LVPVSIRTNDTNMSTQPGTSVGRSAENNDNFALHSRHSTENASRQQKHFKTASDEEETRGGKYNKTRQKEHVHEVKGACDDEMREQTARPSSPSPYNPDAN